MRNKGNKVLITGIAGSGGSYLAEFLVSQGLDVHGISRWHSTASNSNLENVINDITLHECDLNDLSATIRAIEASRPDYIFHLAAHANVHVCFSNPIAVLQNNINGTINLFEAIRIVGIDPVIQFCSTSEVYGLVDEKNIPIDEGHPLDPVNIYAVSKLTQEKIASSYFYTYGTKIIITRMFAYINPRRADIFSSAFAKKIVEIERGEREVLTHGNLNSIRTLIDVRDAMESYWIASQKCEYGVPYNVGGETVISVGDFLEELKLKAKVPIPSTIAKDLLRPIDVTLQVPNVDKFYSATGWKPKYSIQDSIQFLLDHYRGQT
jgi:GDPmannose 4,6-dehydratase/GDP-4-dehydro-6-deoxy-D-mannose reductase